MVRAFYKGRIHKEQYHVKINKTMIPFDGLFGLPNNSGAKGNRIIESPTRATMDKALKLIAKTGSKWNVSPKGIRTLAPNCLTLEPHLWLYFIIATQIRGVISKPRGQLFFPSIMAKLCANMGFMEEEPEVAVNEVEKHTKSVLYLLKLGMFLWDFLCFLMISGDYGKKISVKGQKDQTKPKSSEKQKKMQENSRCKIVQLRTSLRYPQCSRHKSIKIWKTRQRHIAWGKRCCSMIRVWCCARR